MSLATATTRWPMLIDGEDVLAAEVSPLIDPASGDPFAEVTVAVEAEVEQAVAGARAAFTRGAWSRATPAERAEVLERLAGALAEHADEFARAESLNTGKPLKFSSAFDVPLTIDNLRYFAGAARNLEGKASGEYVEGLTSAIRREPLGVVAAVAPWNYPLNMAAWKVGPALAAGNSVVLKPAEATPVTALMLARLALESGLPEGVLNVITGRGSVIGTALAGHRDVDVLSVTGSTATGEAVMHAAAPTVKRLHLELGGKAPFVVFDDAHVEAAVEGAIVGAYANCGQDCTAATRIYVQEAIYDDFVNRVCARVASLRVGSQFDPQTDIGPLISRRQRDGVERMTRRAVESGARALVGGEPIEGPGFFFAPTVIADAAQDSEIVQEEVFGPVPCVLPFSGDDEGLRAANDSRYGLAASAWTRDVFRAQRSARELRAGTVWINEHLAIGSEMPHGGVKGSGFGKDMSMYAVEEYTAIKHVVFELTDAPRKPWYEAVSPG